jgi:hypothetical protein
MKNRFKRYITLTIVALFTVFLFYKDRLSLQIDEKYAGYGYDILLTQGGSYTGVVNSEGLIQFPWNPSRKNGILTIELKKNSQIHLDGLGISPAYGRYFLYEGSNRWHYGRVLYIFGIPIKETKIGLVTIEPGKNHEPNDGQ